VSAGSSLNRGCIFRRPLRGARIEVGRVMRGGEEGGEASESD